MPQAVTSAEESVFFRLAVTVFPEHAVRVMVISTAAAAEIVFFICISLKSCWYCVNYTSFPRELQPLVSREKYYLQY